MTRVAAAVQLTEGGPDFPNLTRVAARMHRDQQESRMAVDSPHHRMCHRLGAQILVTRLDQADGSFARGKLFTASASVVKRPVARLTSGEVAGGVRSAPRARIAAFRFWFSTGAHRSATPESC